MLMSSCFNGVCASHYVLQIDNFGTNSVMSNVLM